MDFRHQLSTAGALSSLAADALLVVIHGDAVDPSLDPAIASAIKDAVAHGDFQFKAGRTLYLHRPAGLKAARLVVAAAGSASVKAFKTAVAHGLAPLKGLGAKHVAVALGNAGEVTEQHAEALATAATDAVYVYRHTKPSAPTDSAMSKFSLVCSKTEARAVQKGLARGQAIAAGVTLAREFANRPGNHCTPSYLADQAKRLGKDHGLKVDVLDRKAVEKLGMGSFLAVAQGTPQDPKLIALEYKGGKPNAKPVVLVGKGLCFDSGGISIKPAQGMEFMKFDMCGAAGVLGTFEALGRMKPEVNVVGIIGATTNMPSGTAMNPGDVVKAQNGKSIEIINTDAEGRLVLADCLSYAKRFDPDVVIDAATLTGACVIALGHTATGVFSGDDALIAEILAAGKRAGEPGWPLPLWDEYKDLIKSDVADVKNSGGRPAGAVTAAMFLKEFAEGYAWAHLDIAGTAYSETDLVTIPKGPTGVPTGTFIEFIRGRVR